MARLARVTEGTYPSLPIRVTFQGDTLEVTALIDSGFDGYLVVPSELVPMVREPVYRQRVAMASREVVTALVFPATIEFVDVPGPFDGIAIALGGEFLLGLLSINRLRVTLDHATRVNIEP